jgi:hypothetical protein
MSAGVLESVGYPSGAGADVAAGMLVTGEGASFAPVGRDIREVLDVELKVLKGGQGGFLSS